jgi:septum formation protein
MENMKKIILASASPRRRELLALTGLKFKVDPGDYQEDMSIPLDPHRLSRFLSLEKAKDVAARHRDALIIAADTFIVFRGSLLGKPHTEREARRMLLMLSGRRHSVITGFTILDTASGKRLSRSVETTVFFRKLTGKEIDAYVKSGEPLDKAGAYAIQGLGAIVVRKIEGDYFNVIGLPLNALAEGLKKFGIQIL